jgi:outer membrane protein
MPRPFARALFVASFSLTTAFSQAPAANLMPAIPVAPDRPLSVEEAIALALNKNFNLQIQGFTMENSRENVAIQEAAFDPTFTAGGTRSLSQQAITTSVLDGTQREGPRNDNTNFRVGAQLPRIPYTNGTLQIAANITRSATNSTNALLNPSYGNNVSATLNQPLFRDFGRRAALAALENAQLAYSVATINYKSNVLTVVSNTENAYYNVVAARELLRIRELTLQANQRLLSENTARRNTGVATDLDVLAAEVQVASARRALVQQEQNVRDTEDALLTLINVSLDARPGAVAFEDLREPAPSFAQSYKLARDFYPDLQAGGQTLRQLELNMETARRNMLPDLDLTAQLGYSARATEAGYQQAIANLPSDHGNNWSIALNYSLPWGQRADKARLRQAANNVSSQKIRLEQLEQQLMADVRSAVRAVETNLVAVEIAAQASVLAERQYEQQKARYDAGLSTSRVVLQFQDDLDNMRFQELSAKLALRRAVAALRRLEGTSLQRFQVQIPE